MEILKFIKEETFLGRFFAIDIFHHLLEEL